MRRKSSLKEGPIYKGYRIYTSRLFSGPWLSMIVNMGRKTVLTKDALTDTVTRVPGEYTSEEEAIQAARAYIDREVKDLPD